MQSELFNLLNRLLCCILSELFDLLSCSLRRLQGCLPSEALHLLGHRFSPFHFHLIEGKWNLVEGERNAEEVHIGIERRVHQPHQPVLPMGNQIPLGGVVSIVYHHFAPCLLGSRRHDCMLYFFQEGSRNGVLTSPGMLFVHTNAESHIHAATCCSKKKRKGTNHSLDETALLT